MSKLRSEEKNLCFYYFLNFCLYVFNLSFSTDADSLRYNIGYSVSCMMASFISYEWVHGRVIGNGEFINTLGLLYGTDCLGAFLQFNDWVYFYPCK